MRPGPRAPAESRRALERLPIAPSLLADLQLIVSELVTNSVRHAELRGGDAIELSVEALPTKLVASVSDPGPGFPTAPQPGMPAPPAAGGRGLAIVDALATRWGAEAGNGCRVWFELSRDVVAEHDERRRALLRRLAAFHGHTAEVHERASRHHAALAIRLRARGESARAERARERAERERHRAHRERFRARRVSARAAEPATPDA